MMTSVIIDSRDPVPTSSGFAITRRGRSGDRAATRAAVEEGCRVQAFEDADAAPRAPNCARVTTSYHKVEAATPSTHGDSPRPHCKSVMAAQPARPEGPWLVPAALDESRARFRHYPYANRCAQVLTGYEIKVYGAAGRDIPRFK